MRPTSPKRLRVELLEDRLTPTTGVPWSDAGSLSLSFVPDGTDAGGGTRSALGSLLGYTSPDAWQREILRAYQTWAAATNVNIGLTADAGLALGAAGLPQGDSRFGDIRVAARPLSAGPGGSLAQATGFDDAAGTWAGDMVLGTTNAFGPAGYDLFSVALHEAGHSLSLLDNGSDPASAMWSVYSRRTGLNAADVAAIQALYGVRSDDPYEGAAGNGTPATAFNLTANGNLTAVTADLTRVGDVDVYRFTTPAAYSGATGLRIDLEAAGISLLTARVTVLNAAGQVVASGVVTDPLSNDVSVVVPGYQASTTYYVKVEGASGDVFSVGAYNLRLKYSPLAYGTSAVTGAQYVNLESGANDTRATAAPLGMVNAEHSTAFTAVGALTSGSDVDWYRITPSAPVGFTGTLSVGLVPLSGNGFRPVVAVYNARGVQLPAVVVTNENGAFTVQLGNQQTGTTYYLKVTAADPSGAQAVGAYTLAANVARAAVAAFDPLGTAALNSARATAYARMTVTETRLTQFSLSVSGAGAARAAVRMSILNGQGQVVFSLVAGAGQPLVTGTLWLLAGEYTVVFQAATADGRGLPGLTYTLGKRELSDPM
ncbi:matrixin family metalloprotease, partial [bacterium]|nr:matrixin family metalloprotease [bacterium]